MQNVLQENMLSVKRVRFGAISYIDSFSLALFFKIDAINVILNILLSKLI